MRLLIVIVSTASLIFFLGCSKSDGSSEGSSTPPPVNTKVRVSSDWYIIDANVSINNNDKTTYLGNGEYEFDGVYTGIRSVTAGVNDVNANEVSDTGESNAPILSAPDGYANINPFTTMLVNGTTAADLGLKYPTAYSVKEDFNFDVVVEAANNFELQKEVADASVVLSAN